METTTGKRRTTFLQPSAWAPLFTNGPGLCATEGNTDGRYRHALAAADPAVNAALLGEEQSQRDGIELIPSENYTWPEVLALLGSVITNKYAEGYPGQCYFGGNRFTDAIETLAHERACALFRGEHANVQPLSGSLMN